MGEDSEDNKDNKNNKNNKEATLTMEWNKTKTAAVLGLFLASVLVLPGCSIFDDEKEDQEQNQDSQVSSAGGSGVHYRSGHGVYFPYSYRNRDSARLLSQGLTAGKGGIGGAGRSGGG